MFVYICRNWQHIGLLRPGWHSPWSPAAICSEVGKHWRPTKLTKPIQIIPNLTFNVVRLSSNCHRHALCPRPCIIAEGQAAWAQEPCDTALTCWKGVIVCRFRSFTKVFVQCDEAIRVVLGMAWLPCLTESNKCACYCMFMFTWNYLSPSEMRQSRGLHDQTRDKNLRWQWKLHVQCGAWSLSKIE